MPQHNKVIKIFDFVGLGNQERKFLISDKTFNCENCDHRKICRSIENCQKIFQVCDNPFYRIGLNLKKQKISRIVIRSNEVFFINFSYKCHYRHCSNYVNGEMYVHMYKKKL